VRTLVLSGLPVEPFAEITKRQFRDAPDLARAVGGCDWPEMKRRMGISCAYLDDAVARPSGRELFERIARHSTHTQFDVFHGNQDWHTPPGPVRELEEWNAREGHLDLRVRYYDGAHTGTPDIRGEMSKLLMGLVPVGATP
jgi:hypothetical protein